MMRKLSVILIFLLFSPSLFAQDLVHDWGGSYRRYLAPPEHYTVRERVFGGEENPSDELVYLNDSKRPLRFFILDEQGEGEDERWYCFGFGSDWNLQRPGRGTWVVKKRLNTIYRSDIYLSPDGSSFLGMEPAAGGKRTVLSLFLEGRLLQRGIRLDLPFSEVLRSPFSRIKNLSEGYVDWSFYLPDPDSLARGAVRDLSGIVQAFLPRLHYEEDGALDSGGRYVNIDDLSLQGGDAPGLNCSGFVKWLVDGLVFPVRGSLLSVEKLKAASGGGRENRWSNKLLKERQPWFGLDWTRNLALEYRRVQHPEADYRQVDVDDLRYHPQRQNVGFPVSWLPSLSYELAVLEPGHFYLLSVNEQRGDPPLREHFHTAALFPYLDEDGQLQIDLFESGEQIPVKSFVSRYPAMYMHLVRLRAESRFDPPSIRLEPTLRRQ